MAVGAATLGPGSAVADVTQVGGGAFGYQVRAAMLSVGPAPTVTLPATGGGPISGSLASAKIPSVLNAGVMKVSTKGGDLGTHQGYSQSSAAVSNLSIAGVVTADQITSQCRSTGSGSAGTVSFVGLKIAGVRVETFDAQTIEVPGVARVVINEQLGEDSKGSTSMTVSALNVTLLASTSIAKTDVVIAQSRCKATGPDVNTSCPCSLWSAGTTPRNDDAGDHGADVNLGVRFRSEDPGFVSAIRFYKSPANVGPHTGNLWTNTGELLASVEFTDETASGWQQASFTEPVPIEANTTYVASYHTTSGHYAFDGGYFAFLGVNTPPLHALAHGVDGPTGVFSYWATPAFPLTGNGGVNYWVDVLFE